MSRACTMNVSSGKSLEFDGVGRLTMDHFVIWVRLICTTVLLIKLLSSLLFPDFLSKCQSLINS